jgi:hypothetical protein
VVSWHSAQVNPPSVISHKVVSPCEHSCLQFNIELRRDRGARSVPGWRVLGWFKYLSLVKYLLLVKLVPVFEAAFFGLSDFLVTLLQSSYRSAGTLPLSTFNRFGLTRKSCCRNRSMSV